MNTAHRERDATHLNAAHLDAALLDAMQFDEVHFGAARLDAALLDAMQFDEVHFGAVHLGTDFVPVTPCEVATSTTVQLSTPRHFTGRGAGPASKRR